MKKNEQLFDIMGDIPDEYVEDAGNDNAISGKRISVKRVSGTIAACAAAFAAIAAVPVLMMYVNGKTGNGDDKLPVTTDTVETTEISNEEVTDAHTENQDKAKENLKNGQLSFGTGPEREENYKPERTYSCAYCPGSYSGTGIEAFLKKVLVDESYADEIVSDYKSEAEKYFRSLGLNESDKIVYQVKNNNEYRYCHNGYIEITASINVNGKNKVISYIYDLVEEKRINNNSDLFYYGEDYIDQIMTAVYGENYDPEFSKPTEITLNSILYDEDVNIPAVMCNPSAGNSDGIPDWIYDISVIGHYRDLSGTIKENHIHKGSYDELYTCYTGFHVDDYTIMSECEKSRFSFESVYNGINNDKKERYAKVLEFIKSNHYLDECTRKLLKFESYDDSSNDDYSVIEVYAGDMENSQFICSLRLDNETGEILPVDVLPVDEDIPEWNCFRADDYTIYADFKSAESMSNMLNREKKEYCTKVYDFLKNNHYSHYLDECMTKKLEITFYDSSLNDNYLIINAYAGDKEDYQGRWGIWGLRLDIETGEILPVDEDIPEWRNYIMGYFKKGEYKQLIRETDFDPEQYDCMCCDEVHRIDDTSKLSPGNYKYIRLSDEEVENPDYNTYVLHICNRETKEELDVLVMMPTDRLTVKTSYITSMYWDSDK